MSAPLRRASITRDEALALGQTGQLLARGLPAVEALGAVGERLPAGPARDQLLRARDAVADGRPVAEGLSEAFPRLGPLLAGDEEQLPARLRIVAAHQRRMFRLRRRVEAAAAYPFLVGFSAVGVLAIVGVALWLRGILAPVTGDTSPSAVPWLAIAGVAGASLLATLLHPYWRTSVGRALGQLLPQGRRMWGLTAQAEFLALWALHRAPALSSLSPGQALEAASESLPTRWRRGLQTAWGAQDLAGLEAGLFASTLPGELALTVAFGEQAGRAAEAGLRRAAQLEDEADRAARHLVEAARNLLLPAAGFAGGLVFLVLFKSIFMLAG